MILYKVKLKLSLPGHCDIYLNGIHFDYSGNQQIGEIQEVVIRGASQRYAGYHYEIIQIKKQRTDFVTTGY